ncbi:hypothetical protein BpHYR1_036129 [Brachionus plicatilis]|uniref:Uncharacterized protein n=1 Tax=Brachionus plicatilis TaxID=10195 RepID=A0A3M7S5U3_BRAPC|nr:hypothetical protein BpHYR1_036129 [Brachionus plicatilis]
MGIRIQYLLLKFILCQKLFCFLEKSYIKNTPSSIINWTFKWNFSKSYAKEMIKGPRGFFSLNKSCLIQKQIK